MNFWTPRTPSSLGGAVLSDQTALSEGPQRAPADGLERTLRITLLQHHFNLADNAVAEALYDSASLRRDTGISDRIAERGAGFEGGDRASVTLGRRQDQSR